MIKITFMGAGSTVFARNVLGDCMCTPALRESEIALYDIDEKRLCLLYTSFRGWQDRYDMPGLLDACSI